MFLALHLKRWPNWVRADCAVGSLALYAFAFAMVGVIAADVAGQMAAYATGFVLASGLEPLGAWVKARRSGEATGGGEPRED